MSAPADRRAALAGLLRERERRRAAAGPTPRPADARVPAAPAQRGMWFLERTGLAGTAYLMPMVFRIRSAVDAGALLEALRLVVRRHEALRTALVEVDGEPEQRVLPADEASAAVTLPVTDLRGLDARDDVLTAVLTRQANTPMPLERAPLLRADLVRLADDEHVLGLCLHHAMCDEGSVGLVLDELVGAYTAIVDGREPDLPTPTVQFGDYVLWQHERAGESGAALEQWWTDTLAGAPTSLELPTDRPRPAVANTVGATYLHRFDAETVAALGVLRERERVTTFMALLAAWALVLGRHAGQDDVVIGAPVTGRNRPGLDGSVGLFMNPVALRLRLDPAATLTDLLRTARDTALDAMQRRDTPFERVAELAGGERDLGRNPVFQAMLVLNPLLLGDAPEGLVLTPELPPVAPARMDLTLAVVENGARVVAQVDHRADLFDTATVARLVDRTAAVLRLAAAAPDTALADVDPRDDTERALLSGWADGGAPIAGAGPTVLHDIAATAATHPGAAAVLDASDPLTHGELWRRARRVAGVLRGHGVGRGAVVALALPAGPRAVVALLGVQLAGAAYLPLDPTGPPDRRAAVLADSRAIALICDPGIDVGGFTGVVLHDSDVRAGLSDTELPDGSDVEPDDPAYLIYTSGSSGEPKGVVVAHATLANLTRAFVARHGFDVRDRILALPPLSFDASVGDVFPALASGAALAFHSDPAALDGDGLLALCRRDGLTVVDTAAALWRRWAVDVHGGRVDPGPLRMVMVGGESAPTELVRDWLATTGVPVITHYGPTEGTVCATTGHDGPTGAAALPVGRPIPGVTVRLLDERLREVGIGAIGQVYLGGAAPAVGYHGRREATDAVFVADPFVAGGRLYRTGDLARWDNAGRLEFAGRVDDQVKIRGQRIEPGEVRAALLAHPQLRDAAVLAVVESGETRLVAFVVPTDPGLGLPDGLTAFLATRLPVAAVPSGIAPLDALPLTAHGKVDERALAALPVPTAPRTEYVEPRPGTEQLLATLWAELLDVARVGRHDGFFALGGHSLLAARVLTRLRDDAGVDLPVRALFESPDLATLASVIDSLGTGAAPSAPVDRSWQDDAVLPPDVAAVLDGPVADGPFADRPSPNPSAPTLVLLTGATGFLGAFLLAELLASTDATIVCPVRAGDPDEANRRVAEALARFGLPAPDPARVTAVPGELTASGLGLPPTLLDELTANLDLVVHSGGEVHFLRPYAALAPANVGGVREVLRIAAPRRVPVHLVSTLGLFLGPEHQDSTVDETTVPDPDGLETGYDRSKWVGDRIVLAAGAAGLPVAVHRPARITGAHDSGAAPAADTMTRLLATSVALGAAPRLAGGLDMAPVDHVASSITALATANSTGVFHYLNPHRFPIGGLGAVLRATGHDVGDQDWAEWLAAVLARPELPFASLAATMPGDGAPRPEPVFDCSATHAASIAAGGPGAFTPADAALVARYVRFLDAAGLLPAPAGVTR